MTEATWGDRARMPDIDWRMSASLENVPKGGGDMAEVTSLERAVRDWVALDPSHRAEAKLSTEHAIQVEGSASKTFSGESIAALADRLPA